MTSIDLGKSFEKFKETIKPKNMINPELYNKTVDILVQAYFNDTLEHGNQCGCAVGNIVAANMGIEIKKQQKNYRGANNYWFQEDSQVSEGCWYSFIHNKKVYGVACDKEKAKNQIESTGYDINEILLIECAFESAREGNSYDEYMFNGLMAVIDVLDKIHENTNTELSQTTKARFKKQLA